MRTRLPEMPAFITPRCFGAGCRSRRSASRSGQRRFAPVVDLSPSVIESPNADDRVDLLRGLDDERLHPRPARRRCRVCRAALVLRVVARRRDPAPLVGEPVPGDGAGVTDDVDAHGEGGPGRDLARERVAEDLGARRHRHRGAAAEGHPAVGAGDDGGAGPGRARPDGVERHGPATRTRSRARRAGCVPPTLVWTTLRTVWSVSARVVVSTAVPHVPTWSVAGARARGRVLGQDRSARGRRRPTAAATRGARRSRRGHAVHPNPASRRPPPERAIPSPRTVLHDVHAASHLDGAREGAREAPPPVGSGASGRACAVRVSAAGPAPR